MTEKLLEAEKKKLTQLELQLDEETGRGISSVDKVSSVPGVVLGKMVGGSAPSSNLLPHLRLKS